MDVVLLQDVEKVGLRGEVVSVSRGFMRNYLGPRKLAQPATAAIVEELGRRDAERAKHEARSLEQARAIAETLTKSVLRFEVKAGPQGVLFGSITPTDVADELWRVRKVRVDRRRIDLPDPIKRVGQYEIPIEVFPDVVVAVKTIVAPEGGAMIEWTDEPDDAPDEEAPVESAGEAEASAEDESDTL
jgi:large subunit ribosomal protein L9